MAILRKEDVTGLEPGMRVDDVPTPALLIDLDRMENNIAELQRFVTQQGKQLRPHIKTHKIPEIALMQERLGAHGIAAAKPAEAEVFVDAGCRDIVVAFPTVGADKWRRLAELARTARVSVNVDSEEQARGLNAAALEADTVIQVQIEIDSGLHRVGLDQTDQAGIAAFARLLMSLPGIELEGVTTHRGKYTERLAAMSNDEAGYEEGSVVAAIADQLRADGISIAEVTAGGSITARGVAQAPGVTEVRAGTYVLNDAMQVAHGSCTESDVAVSVLATVVSTRISGWATIDAGSKTFSGDRAVSGDKTAGHVPVAPGIDIDAAVMRITEEHGMVQLGDGVRVEIGQRLRFMPFHVCTAVNLSNEVVGVRNGLVEKVWPVLARGRRT